MATAGFSVSAGVVAAVVFVFGTMVGSFLNVCIARIPKGESILQPPSHCPTCNARIKPFDNIPIISYLMLFARCRSCGVRIPARYLFVELLAGLLAVVLYREFGFGLAFFSGAILVAAMIVISFIDVDVRIVPDVISLPGIIVGVLLSLIATYLVGDGFEVIPSPLNALLGILVGGGSLYVVAWIYEHATGINGMGGGDIKLLAMIGAFLGWASIPIAIFVASLTGSIVGLLLMLLTGAGRRLALPFAPFLCFGAVVYLFFGQELIGWYFG